MTRGLVVGASLVAVLTIISCASFSGTAAPAAVDEAGADAAAPGDAALPNGDDDDVVPVDADAGCVDINDDFDGTLDAGWIALGNPTPPINTKTNGDQYALLTTGVGPNESGAIWREIPTSTSVQLSVDLEVTVPSGAELADGFAVSWAPANQGPNAVALGESGDNLGACLPTNATKRALGIGVFTYDLSSTGRHIGLLDLTANPCQTSSISTFQFANTMHLSLLILPQAPTVEGQLVASGTTIIPPTVLSRNFNIGWIGLSAGTGTTTSRQAVAHLRVHACP